MALTRRQLIAIGSIAVVSSGIGITVIGLRWWDTPADAPYQKMSQNEALILSIIAGAAFPAGRMISIDASKLNLDRFFDQMLSDMPEFQSKLLKLLLNALNTAPYLDFKNTLSEQSPTERKTQLQTWLNHPNHLFRNAVNSLVILIGMGYTSHPEISPYFNKMHQCGYGIQ